MAAHTSDLRGQHPAAQLLWLGVLLLSVSVAFGNGSKQDSLYSGLASQTSKRDLLQPAHCGPLTKELLQEFAVENTVLVTVADVLVMKLFGRSWIENVKAAGITYWFVAALDPETSMLLASLGVKQCFNAPVDRLAYRGTGGNYQWGSHHWHMTTWNKVHVVKAVYEHGFNVIHSDTDVTWFNEPLPYFRQFVDKNVHVLFTTDMTTTYNEKHDQGLEKETHPYININTGVYWIQQWPEGKQFMEEWVSWQPKNVGHDQDGLNLVVRGSAFRGDAGMPVALHEPHKTPRVIFAAHNKTAGISFLPGSMFGNAYTYVNSRLHDVLNHTLYEIHWVWGGSTLESKRQNMRDAMKFQDEPEYYSEPFVISMHLDQMQTPAGYNEWPDSRTEEMIQFHMAAANYQLQQAYYAFAIALALNRTMVMPRFLCHCSKNWYMTHACRINNEALTQFPFVCALSQVLRVKRLCQGLTVRDSFAHADKTVHIREYSFLDNHRVSDDFKRSRVVVTPAPSQRTAGSALDVLRSEVAEQRLDNGTVLVTLPGPLDDQELIALLEPYRDARVLHFASVNQTFSQFRDPEMHKLFDQEIEKKVTSWCCRSPADMKSMDLPDRIQLEILPAHRRVSKATVVTEDRRDLRLL